MENTKGDWTGSRVPITRELAQCLNATVDSEIARNNTRLFMASGAMYEALKAFVEVERKMRVKRLALLKGGEQALSLAKKEV